MKKIMLLMAALTVSGSLFAQDGNKTGMEWIEEFEGKEKVIINPNYGGPSTTDTSTDYFYLLPLEEQLSALYGSRYHNAQIKQLTGLSLTIMGAGICAPAALIFGIPALFAPTDMSIAIGLVAGLNAAAAVASLVVGIPMWKGGRTEMNAILDDYSKNYAPRPYSASLSLGPTRNGVGIAFKF